MGGCQFARFGNRLQLSLRSAEFPQVSRMVSM